MLNVLINPILPVFAIFFIGYLSGKLGWTSNDDARVLNRFAMTVLLPIFIFSAMAHAPVETLELGPLLVYAAVEAALYAAGYLIARKVFARGPREALLLGFCGVFANNAYYGLPLATMLYGESGTLPVLSVVLLDSTFIFGCTMIALEVMEGRGAGAGLTKVVGRVLRLPLVWALALGAAFGIANAPLPAPLETFTSFVGNAASPVALFAMGVVLSATSLVPEPVVYWVTAVKVIIFPLALFTAIAVFAPSSPNAPLFVLAGSGPSGAMAFSMALLYSVRTDAIMQATVVTSVLTLFTLAYLA